MNLKRKKEILNIVARINHCSADLELIKEDEDYARDNVPENLQNSDSYEFSENCSDALADAIEGLNNIVTELEDVIE